jgi:hypothetical protein
MMKRTVRVTETSINKMFHPLIPALLLSVEIVGSSRAYDLHSKKTAYRRNSVRELADCFSRAHPD